MNITDKVLKIAFLLYENGFIPAPEEVTIGLVDLIETTRIKRPHMTHGFLEIRLGCADKKMIVIVHERERKKLYGITLTSVPNNFQEEIKILIRKEDVLSMVAAIQDVITSAGIFNSERTGHKIREV